MVERISNTLETIVGIGFILAALATDIRGIIDFILGKPDNFYSVAPFMVYFACTRFYLLRGKSRTKQNNL